MLLVVYLTKALSLCSYNCFKNRSPSREVPWVPLFKYAGGYSSSLSRYCHFVFFLNSRVCLAKDSSNSSKWVLQVTVNEFNTRSIFLRSIFLRSIFLCSVSDLFLET